MSELALRVRCSGDQGFELAIDCEIPDRGITAIYGPSGSGKSTLLDCIAGLRTADEDSAIRFRDQHWQSTDGPIAPWQRRIGYVFQDARLFPHLDVTGNLDFAERRAAAAPPASREKLVQWLELEQLLPQMPASLSAGQKQRVAIARALLSAPQLLLLDEPLANLDHRASAQCIGHLQQLARELDLPMLYVSHDIEEVSQLADHLLLLDQGQIEDQGSLLELCTRLDSRLSHEEQAAAIVLGTVSGHDPEFGLTHIEVEHQVLQVNHLEQPAGTSRRVRIPARDVSIARTRPEDSSILNILPVTVTEIENCSGARLLLRLALGKQFLLARITRKSAQRLNIKVGDKVFAQIKSAALLSEAAETE
jgi:molybdate transport system ATP-binding protein